MAVKPYELSSMLFAEIESYYLKFSHTELIKINFLVQILYEAGTDTEIEVEGENLFLKIYGRVSDAHQTKMQTLGYVIGTDGRIQIK